MKNIVLLVSVALVCTGFLPNKNPPHPFYVSITEFEIKQDTMQISLRMFTEDLEMILNEKSNRKVFLQAPADYEKNLVNIGDYLFEHFQVNDGARNLRIEWIGHEFEDDVIWVYGQTAISSEQRLIFIRNSVLTDLFEGQQNMIHYMPQGVIDTKLASKDNPEVRFSLE